MKLDTKDILEIFGFIVAALGFAKGLIEFKKSNKIKRAEFLEKLILEFNGSETFLARKILDDFWVNSGAETEISDKELLTFNTNEKINKEKLSLLTKKLLRDHREEAVFLYGEQRTRESFDSLLDFFSKLDYYISLNLIIKSELYYFQYYLERCAYKADAAVLFYAKTYGYNSLFRLLFLMDIQPKDKQWFKDIFYNETQKSVYENLLNESK